MPNKSSNRSARRPAAKATSMRIDEDDRVLIDAAAAVAHKTRTEFVLESARRVAVETLLDVRAFQLDEAQAAKLDDLLANPSAPRREAASTRGD